MNDQKTTSEQPAQNREKGSGSSCNDLLSADRPLHPGFVREIMDSMAEMSGLVFWRVTGTWANKGRMGKIDAIVEAKTATEAIAIAWECEDDRDLRTIHAEWLCPIESVKRDDSLSVVGR